MTKFPLYLPFSVDCIFTNISSFMPSSSVLNCFYLLVSKFEKLTTWIWRLPFAVNVILNDRNVMVNFSGVFARAQRSTVSKKKNDYLCIQEILVPTKSSARSTHSCLRMSNGKLARSPRHILSVSNQAPWFNLVLDIHVMVNWQLSKKVSAD